MNTQIEQHKQLDKLKDVLQEGDILFISIPNFLYKAIEKGTNSPTSHVGIALKYKGQWMVAESKVPFSRLSTLEGFIARSDEHWFKVKRLKSALSSEQKRALKTACMNSLGRAYDFSFNYHSKHLFCSKFVYEAYKESCDLSIGNLQNVDALLSDCPPDIIPFWRLWFCGFIPQKNVTVTPHSQYIDEQLQEVCCHA